MTSGSGLRLGGADNRLHTRTFVRTAPAPRSAVSKNDNATFWAMTVHAAAITRTIAIPIYANTTPQIDRTIIIDLSSVTGATVARANGVVTILDDD
jgi:hypothetical protein